MRSAPSSTGRPLILPSLVMLLQGPARGHAVPSHVGRVEHPTSGAIVDRLSAIAARVSVAVRGSAGEDAADAVDSEAEDDDDGVDPALRELQEWVQTLDAMQQVPPAAQRGRPSQRLNDSVRGVVRRT